MNNRILATLFALAIALFIGVAPVEAEAASSAHTTHYDNTGNYVCDAPDCTEHVHKLVWTRNEDGHGFACGGCLYAGSGDHTYGNATNNSDGTHSKQCTVEECGYVAKVDHIDTYNGKDCICDATGCGAVMHELEFVARVEPTCEDTGMEAHYRCKTCRHWFVDENAETETTQTKSTIAALGHTTVYEVNDKTHKAVCETCGIALDQAYDHTIEKTINTDTHTVECKVCGYEKTEAHYDEDETCKCDVCFTAMEHSFSTWTKGESGHWQVCTKKNCKAEQGFAAHNYDYTPAENDTHDMKCSVCEKVVESSPCVDTQKVDHKCDKCGDGYIHVWNGDYMNPKPVHKTATCTEDGIWLHYQCNVCGERVKQDGTVLNETTMINPRTDHSELVWNHGPAGHYQVCQNAGCTYKTDVEEHSYVYTDNGDGTHDARCSDCNRAITAERHSDSDTDEDCICDSNGCGHLMDHVRADLTYHGYKSATCEADGNHGYFTCNECGDTFQKGTGTVYVPYEDYVIEKLGHNFVDVKKNFNNQHLQQCTNCGDYKSVDHEDTDGDCLCDLNDCGTQIHVHEIVPVAKVEPSCGKEGQEAYLMYAPCGRMFDMKMNPIEAPVAIPAEEHDNGGAWVADGENHVKKCTKCDEVLVTAAHVDDENYDNRCDECNVEVTLTEIPAVPATCTVNGKMAYWHSEVTGRNYYDAAGSRLVEDEDDLVITKLGHDWTEWENYGNGHSRSCTRCNIAPQTERHTSSNNGCFCNDCGAAMSRHNLTYVDGYAATCEEAGQIAYVRCSCGKLYDELGNRISEKDVSIKATGHIWGTALWNDEAEGEHYQFCTICRDRLYTEHETVLSDPQEGNYHQWTCDCGYVKTQQHYNHDGDDECDECGHDMTNRSLNVENHNSQTVATGDPDTIDSQKNWLQNWIQNLIPGNAGGTSSSKSTTSGSSSNAGSRPRVEEKANTNVNSGNNANSGNRNPGASGSSNVNPGTSGNGSANTGNSNANTGNAGTNAIVEAISSLMQYLGQLMNSLLGK